jgi:ERCC4-type nuclease
MPSSRSINIEATIDTPKVVLDIEKSAFLIEGASYPEDAYDVYDSILDWLRSNEASYNGELICHFKFNVLSSASRKLVYEILLELEKAQEANKNILINWHYEKFDEDMKEVGEDFSELVNLPFNLLPF